MLTFEEFKSFWQLPCHYCGAEIETIGLDRIDNSLGYKLDNVIPCCLRCNILKFFNTEKEFLDHCKKIVSHMKKYEN